MRAIRLVLIVVLLTGTLALPSMAEHTHVMMTGNGQCVVLSAEGGEKYVKLPHATTFPENRRHPLHVNVHLGEPGTRQGATVIWVMGSAGDLSNCAGYVNR